MTTDDYRWLPMTIRWLSDDYPMTIWWLSDDYPMTIWWLSYDYPMTIWWLSLTIPWLSDDHPMTIQWLSKDYHELLTWWCWYWEICIFSLGDLMVILRPPLALQNSIGEQVQPLTDETSLEAGSRVRGNLPVYAILTSEKNIFNRIEIFILRPSLSSRRRTCFRWLVGEKQVPHIDLAQCYISGW